MTSLIQCNSPFLTRLQSSAGLVCLGHNSNAHEYSLTGLYNLLVLNAEQGLMFFLPDVYKAP